MQLVILWQVDSPLYNHTCTAVLLPQNIEPGLGGNVQLGQRRGWHCQTTTLLLQVQYFSDFTTFVFSVS